VHRRLTGTRHGSYAVRQNSELLVGRGGLEPPTSAIVGPQRYSRNSGVPSEWPVLSGVKEATTGSATAPPLRRADQ